MELIKKNYKYKDLKAGQVVCWGKYTGNGLCKYGNKTFIFKDDLNEHILPYSSHLEKTINIFNVEEYLEITFLGTATLPTAHPFGGTRINAFQVAPLDTLAVDIKRDPSMVQKNKEA